MGGGGDKITPAPSGGILYRPLDLGTRQNPDQKQVIYRFVAGSPSPNVGIIYPQAGVKTEHKPDSRAFQRE